MSSELPRHEPRAGFFDAELARFQPSPAQRRIGRWLIALLRVPGALVLLRAWHARRGRGG
jgi:hypothetical protein